MAAPRRAWSDFAPEKRSFLFPIPVPYTRPEGTEGASPMRAAALVCLGLLCCGCVSQGATTPLVSEGTGRATMPKRTATAAIPSAPKRLTVIRRACKRAEPGAGPKGSETCRLRLEQQMAMAAELRIEGHTTEEIAAIMRLDRETVRELLLPTGTINERRSAPSSVKPAGRPGLNPR